MANPSPVREILKDPTGKMYAWNGTTLIPVDDSRQLMTLVFNDGYRDRGTRVAEIPEAAQALGVPLADTTKTAADLENTNPQLVNFGYAAEDGTPQAITNPRQSYDPNGANYVAPTPAPVQTAPAAQTWTPPPIPADFYNAEQPWTPESTRQQPINLNPSAPAAPKRDFVMSSTPNSNLRTVSDAGTITPTSGNVTVRRGSEPPIIVSQQAWNDIYSKNGFTQVASAPSTASPTTPTSTSTTPTTSQPQTGQALLLGPTQFNQLKTQGLSESDIERRGNDIYLKPTSRFYTAPSNTQNNTQTNTSAPTNTGTTTTSTAQTNVNPADKSWIDSYYQKYFDRGATSSELSNWMKETPQALDQFLQKEAKTYGYTSKYFQDDSNKRLESALDIINNSNLPPEIKTLWAATVKTYPSGMEYNATEILNTFNQVKNDTIDPQFRELATIAKNDFQTAMQQQKSAYEIAQEKQRADAGQNIRQAKEGLEASGMTFTGKAVQQLGAESAFAQPGTSAPAVIPNQEAFGGLFHEGQVNQQNRLMATSNSLQNKASMDALNSSIEKQLGSSQAALAGANVTGGITGSLNTQQQGQYAQSLNQIMDNYRRKQTLNTNITTK